MSEFEVTNNFIVDIEKSAGDPQKLKQIVAEFHPGDIAEILEKHLHQESAKVALFQSLNSEDAAEVLVAISDDDLRELLIEEREPRQIAEIVEEMDSDDAADFLGELTDEQSREVLSYLPTKDSAEVRSLLQYPEDSAGGIMQLELVSLRQDQTCSDAVVLIRSKSREVSELHYIFVAGGDKKLTGVLPLPQLILNPKETPISEIMDRDPISVNVTADVEEVAQIFRKYDIVSLAVVDGEGRLLGRILHDDILDVITEETTEDMLKVGGTDENEFDSASWLQAARYRIPWLLSSLLGGVIMARIISGMGAPLEQVIALAAFIPVITGMSGNVSTQSSAIVVRAIVLGKINGSSVVSSYIRKEFRVGIIMATSCGGLMGFIAWMLEKNPGIGTVVGISLFASMGFASMLGTLIPMALHKLGADPVLGAGPIVLTVVDISAIVIYFTISGSMIASLL